jgi:hypothetical protein
MKAPDPPRFPGHGSTRFERRGQVLLMHSEGPFNGEHIQSLAPHFMAYGKAMAECGPWATVNVVTGSALITPEAAEMLRRSGAWTRDAFNRVGAGYVVAPEVEGRAIVIPILEQCYAGVLATAVHADLASALAWAEGLIEQARGKDPR